MFYRISVILSTSYFTFLARFLGMQESRPRLDPAIQEVTSLDGTTIRDIAVGAEHILALDSEGNVWGWGNNSEGQLGIGHTNPQPTPVLIQALEGKNIAQISAGKEFLLSGY